ncbi:hypothetical protein GGI35DRAFT_314748 [Trichoderma velutinum]
MQEAGGQDTWSELLSLLCVNRELGQNGLFAYKSRIIYIIGHHKANRSTNREYNAARFLPGSVQVSCLHSPICRPIAKSVLLIWIRVWIRDA